MAGADEILNSAGERERELRSRRANLVEASGGLALALGGLWAGGAVGGAPGRALGFAVVGACGAFALLVSPRWHGDTRAARGLPERFRAWPLSAALPARTRRARLGTAAVLATGTALSLVPGWPYLLARLGLRGRARPLYQWLVASPEGVALGVAAAALVVAGALLALLRWETWRATWRALALPGLGFAAGIAILGAALRATSPAAPTAAPDAPLERVFFYLAWGLLQQAIFLGWLNTRLRRAIGPRAGARAATALATGVGFGLAHLPNAPLAGVAFFGGSGLGWLFQRDATRNLVVAGLVHAAAGVAYSLWVPGSMDVGPS